MYQLDHSAKKLEGQTRRTATMLDPSEVPTFVLLVLALLVAVSGALAP